MKILGALSLLPLFVAAQLNTAQWPVHDTGLTDAIQWDHYSIMVDGRRTFMWSGEIHYWRLPVPELWRDILEKVKAAGFNAISVYSHWGYHSPNNHTLDFKTGAHDFTPILDIAKEVGLFVTMRGGPYVNAETNAGGFALWTTTGAYGSLRNSDPRYTEAWTPFMTEINKIVEKYQHTNGGPVILNQLENEISGQRTSNGSINTPIADYMVALEKNARQNGVIIPLMTNAPNMKSKSWSKDYLPGPGAQDIYSLDSYPSCWSCNLAECGSGSGATNYAEHFDVVSPTQPSFMAEFQGGSYNPWGGPEGGCPANHGPSFVSVYYRHLLAERITLINLYMLFGGTNWGTLATNVVATSYDYSAPIQETRQIAEKYYETKLVGLFLRAADDLHMTDRAPFSTSLTDTPNVGATELRNPSNGAGFYVVRHSDLKTTSTVDLKLKVRTNSNGNLTIPINAAPIRLAGQQSKVIVADFHFGNNTLVYSTAEVLSHSIIDGQSVLALWLPEGESGEFAIKGGSKHRQVVSGTGGGFHEDKGKDLLTTSYKQQKTTSVLQFDNFRVLLVPHKLAYKFWAPTLTNDPIVPADKVLFVTGPYLVRSAEINKSAVLITGDIDANTELEIYAPSSVKTISWNGKEVKAQKTSYGSLKANLKMTPVSLDKDLALDGWKYSDALPEAGTTYDDSNWVVADHTATPNPTKPKTLPVLYADDYGYHSGVILFRGHFSGSATGASLNVQGGTAFGWSAWLNSHYLGSFAGDMNAASGNLSLSFPQDVLGEKNVLTVAMDHSGHNQRAEALFPRGILSASLSSSLGASKAFDKWTIAGNAGGEKNIDPIRGSLAEGGLHAERLGWHLPGFDTSSWASKTPSEGVSNGTIGFFRTIKMLNLPKGYDASFAFKLSAPSGTTCRVQLYVNGYQYGKFVPHIGHQTSFPVPTGILNVRGENTIGLNIWAQSAEGCKVDVKLAVEGVYESSFDAGFESGYNYLQPPWTEERNLYA